MLLCLNSCWYKYGCLLSFNNSFKNSPNSYFGFTIPNISTKQSIHWSFFFHIFFYFFNTSNLIGCFLICKCYFKLFLQFSISLISVAFLLFSLFILLIEFIRYLLNSRLDFTFFFRPFSPT